MTFPGEASHTYFFRRKVSASRILQVPGSLFPEFLFFCINTFKYGGKITNKQRKIAIFAISFENY